MILTLRTLGLTGTYHLNLEYGTATKNGVHNFQKRSLKAANTRMIIFNINMWQLLTAISKDLSVYKGVTCY